MSKLVDFNRFCVIIIYLKKIMLQRDLKEEKNLKFIASNIDFI